MREAGNDGDHRGAGALARADEGSIPRARAPVAREKAEDEVPPDGEVHLLHVDRPGVTLWIQAASAAEFEIKVEMLHNVARLAVNL